MSIQPSNTNQKQPLSVYTVMLILSSICLLIACIMLAQELQEYGEFPYWNTREAAVSVDILPKTSSGHRIQDLM